MTLEEYQRLAACTSGYRNAKTPDEIAARRDNAHMGLVGEVGELIDLHKKVVHHGHDPDDLRDRMVDEAGDVMWYVAEGCTVNDKGLRFVQAFAPSRFVWQEIVGDAYHNDAEAVGYELREFLAHYDITLDEVLTRNVAKLAERYPCRQCGGAGRVMGFSADKDCPHCDGTGVAFSVERSVDR